MISRDITIDGVTYTVSATTVRGLDEAIGYLTTTLANDKKRKEAEKPKPKPRKPKAEDDAQDEA